MTPKTKEKRKRIDNREKLDSNLVFLADESLHFILGKISCKDKLYSGKCAAASRAQKRAV